VAERETVGLLVGIKFSGVDVCVAVAANGRGVKVDIDTAVSADETTVVVGAHEAKRKAMSKNVLMFLTLMDTFLCKKLPNGVR
jgi:hypothetical protein